MSDDINDEFRLTQQQLRAKAEAQLTTTSTADELLHELQVHQIELEMQNEELRKAHIALEISRDRYVDLYEFAPVGYLTLTRDDLIDEANLTAATLLDVVRKNLLHRRFSRYVAAENQDLWYRLMMDMLACADGEKHCFDLLLKRSDGSVFPAHFDCLKRAYDNSTPMLRLAFVDITQQKQAEAEQRIAAIAFESLDGLMVTDADTIVLKVNRAFTEITGYTPEEVIGKTPLMLKSGCHDESFYAAMWDSLNRTGSWQGEIWDRHKNGEIYPRWLIITAVKDAESKVTHYVSAHMDITDRKMAENEIKHLAFYDPLTDLPNRRLLLDRLSRNLSALGSGGQHGALLFIDLDNFKTLNDTLGHAIGDELLQQVASRLVTCVRERDTVARLGGDEFVIMLQGLSKQIHKAAAMAETVGKKILATLNQPYRLGSHEYHNTPSIGVVLFNNSHQSDELLKWADIAMYQAKMAGRNTLRFFDLEMQIQLEAHANLERDLKIALKQNQFKLYYQIQVNQKGFTVGAEALIRWYHPERGVISPLEFIPVAEETGLILPIGQWVLETACAQLKQWAAYKHTRQLQLAINISARQFRQPDFVKQVLAEIEKASIDPKNLKIELTESVVLDGVADTISKMEQLRKIGVRFSMDDFGTGYSSLSYLTRLPLDQLKIDQSFVRNIGVKHTDAIVVQTIIGLTKILDIEVIAEGVETESQLAFLEQHGCTLFQGYLFSKPTPLEIFEQQLHRDAHSQAE